MTESRLAIAALCGVDLAVSGGETVRLLDPSGKTRRILLGRLGAEPDLPEGPVSVRVDGEDVLALHPVERARKGLAYLVAEPPTFPGVRAADLMIETLRAASPEDPVRELRARIREGFDRLGVDRELLSAELGENLSSGDRLSLEAVLLTLRRPAVAVIAVPESDCEALGRAVDVLREEGSAVLLLDGRAGDGIQADRTIEIDTGVSTGERIS